MINFSQNYFFLLTYFNLSFSFVVYKMGKMKYQRGIIFVFLFFVGQIQAQYNPDQIFDSAIHTVQIHPIGQPLALPIISLNNGNALEISFDDFNANYQDYFYTVELVDSNWMPIQMNDFDYIRGFNQNKITKYVVSNIALQRYFHYQFTFPNSNVMPKLSGNYILKVYKEGDKSKQVFTRRFFVVEQLATVNASVVEPFDGDISKTHQRIKASVDTKNIPNFQNNLLTLKVVQNFRYNDAKTTAIPSFMRNTYLEFNNEVELVFPAGKEARWLDIQSLQLRSDRVAEINNKVGITQMMVKPDGSRSNLLYNPFRDLNGGFLIMNTESLQSEFQNDYAKVLFTYVPKDNIPYLDQKLYLSGALTNNVLDQNAEMQFDVKKGTYQKTLLLKQGYYSYYYILRDRNDPNDLDDYTETEGNHFETENNYTILVYYHAPGARNNQLVGFATVNSFQNW